MIQTRQSDPEELLLHLVIYDDNCQALLVQMIKSQALCPVLRRSSGERVPAIVKRYLSSIGVRGCIGGLINIPEASAAPGNDIGLWIRTFQTPRLSAHELRWLPIGSCLASEPVLPFQRLLLQERVKCSHCLPRYTTDSLSGWVADAVRRTSDRRLTAEELPLRVGDRRNVTRFSTTDGGAVYCLSGSTICSEAETVMALAKCYPERFPTTLAYDSLRSRWLIDSVPGRALSDDVTFENCRQAASELGRLQVAFVTDGRPQINSLTSALQLSEIIVALERDFDHVNLILTHYSRLQFADAIRIDDLRALLQEAANLGVPDAFVHADTAPSNLFLNGGRLRLIDFESMGWGFPLVSIEMLLRSYQVAIHSAWRTGLVDAYCEPWRAIVSEKIMYRAMRVAPLVRVWLTLRRLANNTFERDPERYWSRAFYAYALSGYTGVLKRLLSTLTAPSLVGMGPASPVGDQFSDFNAF